MSYLDDLKSLMNISTSPIIEYRGEITQKIILQTLSDLEKTMDSLGEKLKITRKAFNIITECLQNILRYGEKVEDAETDPIFIFDQQETRYVIASGNLLDKARQPKLQDRLDELNAMDWYAVQEAYKEVIKYNLRDRDKTQETDKSRNSAGLGFIEMMRKSEQRFVFSFSDWNENTTYFLLGIAIDKA